MTVLPFYSSVYASIAVRPQLRRAFFPIEPIVDLGYGEARIAVMRLVVVPVHTYL